MKKNNTNAKSLILGMTDEQWRNLDVPTFVWEHCRHLTFRFRNLVQFGLMTRDDLDHTFFVIVTPVMVEQHQRILDTPRNERPHQFFGRLQAICNTRLKAELYSSLPIPRADYACGGDDGNEPGDPGQGMDALIYDMMHHNSQPMALQSIQPEYEILHCAPMHAYAPDDADVLYSTKKTDEMHLLEMVEIVRDRFTANQYAILFQLLFGGKTVSDLARERGVEYSTIRSSVREIRKKLTSNNPIVTAAD